MANLHQAEGDPKHGTLSGGVSSSHGQPVAGSCAPGRDAGAAPGSVPSFAAASKLLSAPYSCLVMDTHRRHVVLPPMYLKKKRTGIHEELEAELLRFSQSLNGVPLAYDNIRIMGQQGNIYDDSGYIHMEIEANFIVFQPKKGQKLLGKVNKLSASHVGCLVHGCFNASIPKPNLVSSETWRDAGPRIGADLEFEVTALDADLTGVLLIRGRLDKTRVQELLAMGESSESRIPTEHTEETTDSSPKKKKKKKKDKIKVEEETEESQPTVTSVPYCQLNGNTTSELKGTMDETNGNEGSVEKKKKKKKKKEKYLKEEEEELLVSPMEVQGSDSSGYLSDKSSKKRKHETDKDIVTSLSEEPKPPKSKKKRKNEPFA